MNNPFYNNSLLSKLCVLIDELTETEDREVIEKLIRKQMPKQTKYNFSLAELSSISPGRASQSQTRGIRKCNEFATNYINSLYKIDFDDLYNESIIDKDYDILYDLMDNKWDDIIEKMTNDFYITRALICKTTPIELRTETIESFDLYATNLFIEEYQKIVKEYQLLKTKTKQNEHLSKTIENSAVL